MDVLAAYREVGSFRGAAAICGTTHKTVRRIVEQHQAGSVGGVVPGRKDRGHNYDDVVDVVTKKVESSKGRISAKRLLPAARTAGYEGSARNFRRLVATQKALWRKGNHRGRRPAVWTPGDTLVIDWGVLDGVHVFCAVLAWSRVRFVRFADNERADTTLGLLAECFEVLGGVPRIVLADRMGCLKAGVVANVVVPTADYVRFATHYGFRPDFCHANDPESKGIVENLVGYSKRDLMIPAQTSPANLPAANTAAAAWCAEVNTVAHSEICAVPAERLEQERPLLAVLPSLRLEIGPAPISRKVDKLSCVRFGSARYSVPVRLIGTIVLISVLDGRVQILESFTGEIVAEHRLVAPGETSIADEHYGSSRPDKPRRAPRARTAVEQQFLALGEIAEQFLVGAAAAGVNKLPTELSAILTLHAAHGHDALIAALTRAVEFGRWRADDVRSILAAGRRSTPASPGRAGAGADAAVGADPAAVRLRVSAESRHEHRTAAAGRPISTTGCKRLKMAAMRRLAPELLVTAKTQRWNPEEFLRTLVEAEITARDESNARTRMRHAAFPVVKTLEEFDVAPPRSRSDLRLPRLPRVDPRRGERLPDRARPAPASPTSWSRSASPPSRPDTGSATSPPPSSSKPSTAALADNSVGRVIDTLLRNDLSSSTNSASPRSMTPARNCCSASSPPPTNAAHSASARTGPSNPGAGSCPNTPPPSACSTGSCTTATSSSPTATATA